MGQQPNIEIEPSDLPRQGLPPRIPGVWNMGKPGVINTPDEMPRGAGFGRPGPDTGYALVLIRRAHPEGLPKRTEAVYAALVAARASHFGRAPMKSDLDVARDLMGLGDSPDEDFLERQKRWIAAVAHEKHPGGLALFEVGDGLYADPETIRTWSEQ